MMDRTRRHSRWGWFGLLCLASVMMFGCGGGGGGDDAGGGGTPAPTVPTVINYAVGQSAKTPLLTGTAEGGITFTVTSINLAGTYNRSTTETTLAQNRSLFFTVSGGPLGATSVQIVTPAGSTAQWNSGDNPTSGTFDVNSTNVGPYRVRVNNTIPGVDIYSGGNIVSSLTWAQFKSAIETSSNDYEILPSLAYNALQTVYRCLSVTYSMIEVVMMNQDTLSQGLLNVSKSGYFGLTAGMTAQWVDNNSNRDIDPGDGFFSRFSGWWVDNPGSNQDYIYNGRMVWLDYWEGVNSSGNFVGGDFKIGVSGDAFFEDEINAGVPDPGTRMTYQESGYQFVLSW